jgi:superoxide dismutase, Fe-Mn family
MRFFIFFMSTVYTLPALPYALDALEPYYDQATLELHYGKHHKAYVDGANASEAKLQEMRTSGDFSNMKAVSKNLAFNVSGHILHSLFWENMTPADSSGNPSEDLLAKIIEDFGSFETFQKEFSASSIQVEGSGWGILGYRKMDAKLVVLQAEKHQDLTQWGTDPLLVCDVWEHAYYLKFQNRRPEWLESFWKIVNWEKVSHRFSLAKK